MNLDQQIERSRSSEKIDFRSIACLGRDDPMVRISSTDRILVEPIWTLQGDYEGRMYADYIAEHPEYDGLFVRDSLSERLVQAAAALPANLNLVLRAGHRPLAVQTRVLHECAADYKRDNPAASAEDALAHARVFVSDPAVKRPPHCCGAAVDVTLYDVALNKYVDFGSGMNDDAPISYLHSDAVSPSQRANRLLLLRTMLGAGFASYYAEWWHYSYGDEIWAWFYGHDASLYDLAEVVLQPKALG